MTIAERRHLALLTHQHRQLTQACKRLVLAANNASALNQNDAVTTLVTRAAIAEIAQLLHKWELSE